MYLEMAKEWLQYKYDRELEDLEVLQSLEQETQDALMSTLHPIQHTEIVHNVFYCTRYLMLDNLYNKVKKELES